MTTAAPFALGAVAPPCPGAHAPAPIRDRPFRAVATIVACSPSTIAPDTLRIELRATIVTPTLDARNLYFVAGVCRRDALPEHLRELVAESLRDQVQQWLQRRAVIPREDSLFVAVNGELARASVLDRSAWPASFENEENRS